MGEINCIAIPFQCKRIEIIFTGYFIQYYFDQRIIFSKFDRPIVKYHLFAI